MADRTVVVLGGGTDGLVAVRRLRRSIDAADRVVLVDRDATLRFAPSYLWVMTGARRAGQITTDRRRLRGAGGVRGVQADDVVRNVHDPADATRVEQVVRC